MQLAASTPVSTHGRGEVAWKSQSTKCRPATLLNAPPAELRTLNILVAVTVGRNGLRQTTAWRDGWGTALLHLPLMKLMLEITGCGSDGSIGGSEYFMPIWMAKSPSAPGFCQVLLRIQPNLVFRTTMSPMRHWVLVALPQLQQWHLPG